MTLPPRIGDTVQYLMPYLLGFKVTAGIVLAVNGDGTATLVYLFDALPYVGLKTNVSYGEAVGNWRQIQ